MSKDIKKDLGGSSSSSLSSVGPAMAGLGFSAIFSQPKLLSTFNEARMQQKMEVLDLSIGIKSQKKFINIGHLDELQDIKDSTHLAKNLVDKDKILTSILWIQTGERNFQNSIYRIRELC
jgi:hypothetical protein